MNRPIQNNICQSCLSQERKLFPLIFLQSTVKDVRLLELENARGFICWECKSLLYKFFKFKEQVSLAQSILACINISDTRPLTTLSTQVTGCQCNDCQISIISNNDIDIFDPSPELKTLIDFDISTELNDFLIFNTEPKPNEIKSNVITQDNNILITFESAPPDNGDTNAFININDPELNEKEELQSKINDNIQKINIDEQTLISRRKQIMEDPYYTNSPFKCETCLLGFLKKSEHNTHDTKNHDVSLGNHVCKICSRRYKDVPSLTEHTEQHYEYYKCKVCNIEKDKLPLIRKHVVHFHPGLLGTPGHKCTMCPSVFLTAKALWHHNRKCHNPDGHTCNICGQRFPFAYRLKKHELTHGGMSSFRCNICYKLYKGKDGLKTHMEIHNAADDKAFCDECGVHFRSVNLLRRHLRTSSRHVKEEDLKFHCEYCDMRFVRRDLLQQHLDCKHSIKKSYECNTCHEKFKAKRTLYLHNMKVHKQGEQTKYMCDICGKCYTEKLSLQQHQFSHGNSRPYSCEICGATFNYSTALYTHKKLKHNITKRNNPASHIIN